MNQNQIQIWVCADCLDYIANGEDNLADRLMMGWETPERAAEIRAFRGVPNGWSIDLGLLKETHDRFTRTPADDDGCYDAEGAWHGDRDCAYETVSFSWSPCDACGTPLGGSRHAASLCSILPGAVRPVIAFGWCMVGVFFAYGLAWTWVGRGW